MLLVIDVGNTNYTLGVFEKEKLEATFRMTANNQELRMNMESSSVHYWNTEDLISKRLMR